MGQILVRNLSDDTIASFKRRAKMKGTSLEQEIRELIEQNADLLPEEKLAIALRIQAMTPPGPKTDVVQLLREDRDR
ncbi:FitA-like ribbon-helix-helix domain-containing protein [Methylovirgula sp. 4M-Z18]|uniref:FitA-like ribbon-helix-helix domain-containing protein n=1 Tax=Methylovirgula sp. 4M-Z18 TaxID=2293567 RepID=UPI0011C05A9B|nr:hypothetical protein [Methylovirgula sp. 4M-Z18]